MNRTLDWNCGFLVHITHIDDCIVQIFSPNFKGILTKFKKLEGALVLRLREAGQILQLNISYRSFII
jgi:hypothetical protein